MSKKEGYILDYCRLLDVPSWDVSPLFIRRASRIRRPGTFRHQFFAVGQGDGLCTGRSRPSPAAPARARRGASVEHPSLGAGPFRTYVTTNRCWGILSSQGISYSHRQRGRSPRGPRFSLALAGPARGRKARAKGFACGRGAVVEGGRTKKSV